MLPHPLSVSFGPQWIICRALSSFSFKFKLKEWYIIYICMFYCCTVDRHVVRLCKSKVFGSILEVFMDVFNEVFSNHVTIETDVSVSRWPQSRLIAFIVRALRLKLPISPFVLCFALELFVTHLIIFHARMVQFGQRPHFKTCTYACSVDQHLPCPAPLRSCQPAWLHQLGGWWCLWFICWFGLVVWGGGGGGGGGVILFGGNGRGLWIW